MSKAKKSAPKDLKAQKMLKELDATRGKNMVLDDLKNEHDFLAYIRKLGAYSKRYMVFIAASDTPCGPVYTEEMSRTVMKALGLRINLCGMYRHGYAAAIDAGDVIYERITDRPSEILDDSFSVEGLDVRLYSVGYGASAPATAGIFLNSHNHATGSRGLNFAVYDRVTGYAIDRVSFDTFAEKFACLRPSEILDGVREFRKNHPHVLFLPFSLPVFPTENLSDNEKMIKANGITRGAIMQNIDTQVSALNQYFDNTDDIREVLTAPKSYHDVHGVRHFEDTQGRHVNTMAGHRVTTGQPDTYKRTIFVVGGCDIFGIGAADGGTVASHLQRLLNLHAPEQEFLVENYGFFLREGEDSSTGEDIAILNSLPVRDGDIVLCNFGFSSEWPGVNVASGSKRPHDYGELFFDIVHRTEAGYRMTADRLFEHLQQNSFYPADSNASANVNAKAAPPLPAAPSKDASPSPFSAEQHRELTEYKQILTDYYNQLFGVKIGTVVMNCNPFTLGHRYLVEQAASRCDHLMLFVVQEDRSDFPFDDRIKLVDAGTADIPNVSVIPSGRFIISSLTFSDYFNKSEIQDRTIDTSLDVTLFATEIAPCLNIRIRFVGEEPFDRVTRQYNDSMRAILPQYGIEFVEIPRKQVEGDPISASRVRKLLKSDSFEQIKALVPATTYDYLVERYQNNHAAIARL